MDIETFLRDKRGLTMKTFHQLAARQGRDSVRRGARNLLRERRKLHNKGKRLLGQWRQEKKASSAFWHFNSAEIVLEESMAQATSPWSEPRRLSLEGGHGSALTTTVCFCCWNAWATRALIRSSTSSSRGPERAAPSVAAVFSFCRGASPVSIAEAS